MGCASMALTAGDQSKTEVIRPWKMLDGSINQQFLSDLRRRIYGVILHHPGIYLVGPLSPSPAPPPLSATFLSVD
jgi:hypothetical protein